MTNKLSKYSSEGVVMQTLLNAYVAECEASGVDPDTIYDPLTDQMISIDDVHDIIDQIWED